MDHLYHLQLIYLLKCVIVHSYVGYVGLPEGRTELDMYIMI